MFVETVLSKQKKLTSFPVMGLGRRKAFFKLSDVDGAINRRFKRNAIW